MDSLTWWNWLMAPISGAATHSVEPVVAWHARLMTLAWGIFAPLGVLVARYWKLWPGQQWPHTLDHKGWWNSHRILQWSTVLCATLGIGLLWQHNGTSRLLMWVTSPAPSFDLSAGLHFAGGLLLLVLAWFQVVAAYLRGSKGGPTDVRLHGDHYNMTPRRRRFEVIHKTLGWSALLFSWLLIMLGLWVTDAPRWMPVILLVWWGTLFFLALLWQRQGRCVDTYQAIWGASPDLPGLAFKPIGWGIRRLPFVDSSSVPPGYSPPITTRRPS